MNTSHLAAVIHNYGGPEVLSVEQVPMPQPGPDDVLVRIHAASVNPVDWKIREGYLKAVLPHAMPLTLGWDFAGEIVALGAQVTGWQVGDAVYARPDIARNGSYAEYIAVRASEIARKPASLTWQQAAAVPLTALTAWQSLFDHAQLQAGERVLIHAGAGGVGNFAIQFAKQRGAHVITTTSTANIELVKSLGADEVIDYTQQDFASLRDLDVVFDTLGGEIQTGSLATLRKGGRIVTIVGAVEASLAAQHGVTPLFCFVQPSSTQLEQIAQLADNGKLRVVIDSVFALKDVAAAHARSESGRARGKIVIQVS
ncbi:NADP-dependent oxidoreductase [Niveibacterium umoris]|uniref:NADPH:quinone reductase-like Zn-dependent oxidoreductase n=1 Tax=Niveibacterium umoris TaxID=1193620 RepID=A0A840BP55_9RHOO|nr:NADP-dependent oxidoreductase [Niveibacterium umoris]MBB4013452.1 NADPH:quinone reductase-like Zn-dependent oxidoreductase [Niveibacterium umoris]